MTDLILSPKGANPRRIPLNAETTSLGRGESNDISIDDPSISGMHCRITLKDERVVIEDLGSTNGTFVNGARIEQGQLEDGQTFHLGNLEIQLCLNRNPEQKKVSHSANSDHAKWLERASKEYSARASKEARKMLLFLPLMVIAGFFAPAGIGGGIRYLVGIDSMRTRRGESSIITGFGTLILGLGGLLFGLFAAFCLAGFLFAPSQTWRLLCEKRSELKFVAKFTMTLASLLYLGWALFMSVGYFRDPQILKKFFSWVF